MYCYKAREQKKLSHLYQEDVNVHGEICCLLLSKVTTAVTYFIKMLKRMQNGWKIGLPMRKNLTGSYIYFINHDPERMNTSYWTVHKHSFSQGCSQILETLMSWIPQCTSHHFQIFLTRNQTEAFSFFFTYVVCFLSVCSNIYYIIADFVINTDVQTAT